jgi:GAF domain-containing protein
MMNQAVNERNPHDMIARLRVRYVQVLALFSIGASILGLAAQMIGASQRGELGVVGTVITVVFLVANLLLLALVRLRYVRVASLLLVIAYTLAALRTPVPAFLLVAILTLVSAATLSPRLIYILANLFILGRAGFDLYDQIQLSNGSMSEQVSLYVSMLTALVVVSISVRYFINTALFATQESERSTHVLNATATIGQITATLLTLGELLPRAVELIRDQLAFYHVQVFLVNETGELAVLTASTGEVGQQLLERQHRLAVGSRSVIGRVTQSGEPAIARDTDADAVHYRNELLPLTRSELALPLVDGNKIIGALDVQSTRRDAFQPADIQALQVLANQLATAIRNARLFEQQTQSALENKRFFLEAEANLREIQRLNQQLTKTGWTDYLRDQHTRTGVTLEAERIVQDASWSESLLAATQSREPVSTANGHGQVIAVPVMLRGEVIGAIEVEPGDEMNGADAVDMVQAVAQRLAVSLDNARLFEEAQAATVQEQRINAIVSQYQSVSSVDDLLRITLTELSQSLGAQRGAIRLGSSEKETGGLAR